MLDSPIEADETYFGGRLDNMHATRRALLMGGGVRAKTPVVAVKSRATKKIVARVAKPVSSIILQRMVQEMVKEGSTVYRA